MDRDGEEEAAKSYTGGNGGHGPFNQMDNQIS